MKDDLKLLEQLTQTPSVPGREDRVREVISDYLKSHKLVDEMRVDAMGSLVTVRSPRPRNGSKGKKAGGKKPLRVMLAAHMDQIGFLVSWISCDGSLRVNAVGGFDTRNLFARRVKVCTATGDLLGVLNPGGKPIHIASEEEKKKIPLIEEFYIDVGLSADEAKKRVKVGDMVVLDAPFGEVGGSVVAQCLDNRVGCWATIKALERLSQHECEIHTVFTVQEEVGLRGAGPAAYGIEPDLGISCDTTLCVQTPGVPEEQWVTRFGEGVCIKVMDSSTIADIRLVEDIEAVAAKHKIKCQRGVLPRGGQDGAMIQRSRVGVRTAVFACPIRYIHTVCEMAHKGDLESYHQLLAAYLAQL